MRLCDVSGCENPILNSRGWCNRHYLRWRRHGDPTGGGVTPTPKGPECSIDGCTKKPKGRGWCAAHWERWSVYGDPLAGGPERTKRTGACSQPGCLTRDYAHGFCSKHYNRWRRYGDPDALPKYDYLTKVLRVVREIPPPPFFTESGLPCWLVPPSENVSDRRYLSIDDRSVACYRLTYAEFVGPIPEGLALDHLCMRPPCVNPWHLEPVTASVNSQRHIAARRDGRWASRWQLVTS